MMKKTTRNVLKITLIFVSILISMDCLRAQGKVEIRIDEQRSLAINFESKTRLSGGTPLLEKTNWASSSLHNGNSFIFKSHAASAIINFRKTRYQNIKAVYLSIDGKVNLNESEFAGMAFSSIPDFRQGVSLFRYKPWNSWTKPVRVNKIDDLQESDIQFFYWRYTDNVYGVAIPLSGEGYRTTLGKTKGMFCSQAVAYVSGHQTETVPAMLIGFDKDFYRLVSQAYQSALEIMGVGNNLVTKKKFPEPFEYLGWCTWNASENGTRLNEATVTNGVKSFYEAKFPLGWVLIDDGWFDHSGSRLNSFKPDSLKFPHGFKPMIDNLKSKFGLKYVGAWQTLNGYWNGINPSSPLGERYKPELFEWNQHERLDKPESPIITYHFIKPTSDSLRSFYRSFHQELKHEGFSFIKVDNQSSIERISYRNYPIFDLAQAMHKEMNLSAKAHFSNAMINCMDMTVDAFYNFGDTPIARSVEDYFPYQAGEGYNLQKGNAAAHVLQGVFNNIYFSQMVFPDLDMFQSHNPNAEFHAVARALNNGPIYITDNPGEQNFELLRKLVRDDGRLLRSHSALLPSTESLFQIQDAKPFKASSVCNGTGLLGIWNCADADSVSGTLSPKDVNGLHGDKFAVYNFKNSSFRLMSRNDLTAIKLNRLEWQLYYVIPVIKGSAIVGVVNKFNAPATITKSTITKKEITTEVLTSGDLVLITSSAPKTVTINGQKTEFHFNAGQLTIKIRSGDVPCKIIVKL